LFLLRKNLNCSTEKILKFEARQQLGILDASFLSGDSSPPMHVPAWGTTYYVDATGGNDNNTGTTTTHAFKSMSKVNTSTFSAGDSILFKRGKHGGSN